MPMCVTVYTTTARYIIFKLKILALVYIWNEHSLPGDEVANEELTNLENYTIVIGIQ